MNAISSRHDFALPQPPSELPNSRPGRRHFGILRRVFDAIELSRQRAVERELVRVLRGRLNVSDGPLSDGIERRLFEHLMRHHGFRP